MELPILFVLLTSFVITVSSHPKNSDILPKDYYYQRQVLQPIPGYIPVYIKADGEPVVRTQPKKPIANVHPQKTVEVKEKDLPRHSDEKVSVEKKEESSGGRTEGVENGKDTPSEVSEKQIEGKTTMNEHSEVDDAKVGSNTQKIPQTVS